MTRLQLVVVATALSALLVGLVLAILFALIFQPDFEFRG
jgi:hypothetical protein